MAAAIWWGSISKTLCTKQVLARRVDGNSMGPTSRTLSDTPESTRSKTVSQTAAEEAASEEACSGNCCGRGCSGRGLNQSAAMWKMHLQRKRLPGKEGAPEKLQTLLSSRQCRPHQAPVRLDPTSPCTFLPAPLLTHLPTQHPSLAECHVSNSLL